MISRSSMEYSLKIPQRMKVKRPEFVNNYTGLGRPCIIQRVSQTLHFTYVDEPRTVLLYLSPTSHYGTLHNKTPR